MIRYYKLFDLLQRRDMKISDLRDYIASTSLTKLKKGGIVQTDVINKLCWLLNCQPADIMEYVPVPEEKIFSKKDKVVLAFEKGLGSLNTEEKAQDIEEEIKQKSIFEKAKETGEQISHL